jgi:glutaredoxin 3
MIALVKVEIYSSDHCSYCQQAKRLLDSKQVSYHEYRIDLNEALRSEMLARSQGRRTVPQIFINDQPIGGCDDLYALEREKRLDALLQAPVSQ